MAMSPYSGTIEISELCFTYLCILIADGTENRVIDTFHVDDDGEVVITATGERVIASANSDYAFGEVSTRWGLMQRFVAGGMDPILAVRTAINIYISIPDELVLTNRTANRICEHYANDGDRNLIFGIDHQGELTIYPQAPTQSD